VPDLRLTLNGDVQDNDSLWDWLREEPDLRGRVHQASQAVPGHMGAMTEIIVTAATSGTIAALARSLSIWIAQRRSDVSVTITSSDGKTVSVDASRVTAADELIRTVLDKAAESNAPVLDGPAP